MIRPILVILFMAPAIASASAVSTTPPAFQNFHPLQIAAGGNGNGNNGNGNGNGESNGTNNSGKNRARGNQAGGYALTVAGHYCGTGSATISTTVSLSAAVKAPDGSSGTLAADNLAINKGYFTGSGTIMGVACTVEGRIDLPAASDAEQSDAQAVTGRITGTFKDANGNVGRIVAIQSAPATTGNNGNGNGNK